MSKRQTTGEAEVTAMGRNSCNKKLKVETDGTHLTDIICDTRGQKSSSQSDGKQQQGVEKTSAKESFKAANEAGSAPAPDSVPSGNHPNSSSQSDAPLPPNPTDDREYFASYSRLDIHRTMIDDSARTQAYRHAILTNYPLFYGKTVLDVGCGTGILSVFCCQAGARRVYAVEASDAANFARLVAAENGYADRVRVLQCRVEEASLPEQVDVIVSEWMGHALLYESMLESVLAARGRWLRPGGAMFPDRAVLKMALCTAPGLELETGAAEFWRGVHGRYGVHMACLAAEEERGRWRQLPTRVTDLLPEEVHSHSASLFDLDLRTVPVTEVLKLVADDSTELRSFGRAELTGLALWFDVHFPGGEVLSTSPYRAGTHWAQTVLPLEPLVIDQDDVVRCPLLMKQDESHPRNWKFGVKFSVNNCDARSIEWVMDGTS